MFLTVVKILKYSWTIMTSKCSNRT